MNTKPMQFNRHKVAALLLASPILAAGLARSGADTNNSTVQPAQMRPSAAEVDYPGANFSGSESQLSWFPLKSVKGRKRGSNTGEF